MNRQLKDNILLALGALLLLFIVACRREAGRESDRTAAQKYTCPMHPQVISDKPGTCPICKMDLVPQDRHAAHDTVDADLGSLVRPTNTVVLADIGTVKPQEGIRYAETSLQGVINYDANNWRVVSSRVSGRIERLYVKYNYQAVSKGQKLMDIYSPDLAAAQQELLYLKDAGDPGLLEAAKRKLRLLGSSEQQIKNVLRSGKVDYTVPVYSPYSGYVAEQTPVSGSTSSNFAGGATMVSSESAETTGEMGSMAGSTSANAAPSVPPRPSSAPLLAREGQYVGQGQVIFRLIKAEGVWAEFFASPEQLKSLKKGSLIQVSAADNSGAKASTRISLIQPYYSEGSNFSLVKSKLSNLDGSWKVGQLINVKTELNRQFGTWLPRTSVLNLGTRQVVFVKRKEVFAPAYVRVEGRAGDWINIGSSLSKEAEIAANAWFLVDPESFIQVDTIK